MFVVFLACGMVLSWRLWTFQVRDTVRFQQLALAERHAQIPIKPSRGALLDTNGYPLAVSVRYDSVYGIGSLMGNVDKTAATLSPLLEMPADEIKNRIQEYGNRPAVLKSHVPSALAEQIKRLNISGVYLDKDPMRQYPEGSLAAQVLGFVGRDFVGLSGMELSFHDELAGVPGVIDTEQDTSGQEIALGRRLLTPPREGSDVVLTIDRYVQRVAERLLNQAVLDNKARGGLIMVMEPRHRQHPGRRQQPDVRPDRRRDLQPGAGRPLQIEDRDRPVRARLDPEDDCHGGGDRQRRRHARHAHERHGRCQRGWHAHSQLERRRQRSEAP